uniref:Alternative protein ANKRD31 n=1 Tax=Homo sapiens TaxID=9606 RepID=L8E6U2_HUMAN|nr:alternative protein ANKRD31 [Homo sapiens]
MLPIHQILFVIRTFPIMIPKEETEKQVPSNHLQGHQNLWHIKGLLS